MHSAVERPIPQIKAYQTEDAMGICTLHISWTMPSNTAISHVLSFDVYIDGTPKIEVVNVYNETLTTTHYSMCSCDSHIISVRAINLCGYPSENSPDMSIIPMPLQLEGTCETPSPATVHTTPESDGPIAVHTTPKSDDQTCYGNTSIIIIVCTHMQLYVSSLTFIYRHSCDNISYRNLWLWNYSYGCYHIDFKYNIYKIYIYTSYKRE